MTRSENERIAPRLSQFDTEGDGKKSLRRMVTAGHRRQTSRGGRAGAVAWFFFIMRESLMALIRIALGAITQRLSRMLSTQLMTRSCRSCRRVSAEPSMNCTASSLSQPVSRIYSWTASSYACSACSASRSIRWRPRRRPQRLCHTSWRFLLLDFSASVHAQSAVSLHHRRRYSSPCRILSP
jgi:hypothetical protein